MSPDLEILRAFPSDVKMEKPPAVHPVPGTHLYLVLWKAFQAFRAYDQVSVDQLGICHSDFAVLEILLHKGPLPVNTIGKKVLLTSGSMTAAVNRLEKAGWVYRQKSDTDARVCRVHLSKEGRSVIAHAFEDHQNRLEEAVEILDAGERHTLSTLLKKLGKHLAQLPKEHGSKLS